MDEGIIIRSIFSLLLKLKSFYDASITRRIVDAFSAFFRNLADGSRIIVYFRKYDMNNPSWENSFFGNLFCIAKTGILKILTILGEFLSRVFENSIIITFCNKAYSHIEKNILRSAGIFTGSAAAAFMAASLLGGILYPARLAVCLGIIIFSTILVLLPFDIREVLKNSIFGRLIRYIYS